MSLADLENQDALRIVKFSDDTTIAEFSVISDDTIDEELVNLDVSLTVPVYGTPYLILKNPIASAYTSLTINMEGTADAFDTVASECASPGTFQIIKLVIGGDFMDLIEFVKGVVVNVARKKNVTHGDEWVTGSITFLKIP